MKSSTSRMQSIKQLISNKDTNNLTKGEVYLAELMGEVEHTHRAVNHFVSLGKQYWVSRVLSQTIVSFQSTSTTKKPYASFDKMSTGIHFTSRTLLRLTTLRCKWHHEPKRQWHGSSNCAIVATIWTGRTLCLRWVCGARDLGFNSRTSPTFFFWILGVWTARKNGALCHVEAVIWRGESAVRKNERFFDERFLTYFSSHY